MHIYTSLHIGEFHTNHCEDFLIAETIGSNRKLIAVMDGCTMGTESVFASLLLGKVLRTIAKKNFYEEFRVDAPPLQMQLKAVLKTLFSDTKKAKNLLSLETNELLSTLILGIVDTAESTAEFITIGDGLICIDGALVEYDQNDKPDYLGYHLSDDFEYWYTQQEQRLSIEAFKDLSICTDGIFSFKNFENKAQQKSEAEIIAHILIDKNEKDFINFLDRKIRQLKDQHQHVVTDDLAIVRVIVGS